MIRERRNGHFRWDIEDIDHLPPTIRLSFWASYNSTDEIAYQFLKISGVNVLPHLHQMWAAQCKGYLSDGFKPKLEEYIDNAVKSIGVFNMLHSYFLGTTEVLTEEAFGFVCSIPRIMCDVALIIRMNNDLGTTKKELERGDILNAMQCYMNEHDVSEETAREAFEHIVQEAWKSMNEREFDEYPDFISTSFIRACRNIARASHWFYRCGDGYGNPGRETKDHLTSLIVDPVYVYT